MVLGLFLVDCYSFWRCSFFDDFLCPVSQEWWYPTVCSALRKHAYSNILKILQPKKKGKSSDKNSDNFHISSQNIDCGLGSGTGSQGKTFAFTVHFWMQPWCISAIFYAEGRHRGLVMEAYLMRILEIFSTALHKSIRCRYSLEVPRWLGRFW